MAPVSTHVLGVIFFRAVIKTHCARVWQEWKLKGGGRARKDSNLQGKKNTCLVHTLRIECQSLLMTLCMENTQSGLLL